MGRLWLALAKRAEGRREGPTLKNLEILDVRIFAVHIELDPGHGDIEENAVINLTESSAANLFVSFGVGQ
jgi:hypothetical protein